MAPTDSHREPWTASWEEGNESLLGGFVPTPSASEQSLTSLEPPESAISADGTSVSRQPHDIDLDANHLTTSLGTLRGASMVQTLLNYFAATAGHCLLDVTQTVSKCSVSGIVMLCSVVPLAVDRSAGMLLEITEVTRCTSYSDVAYTIAGCPGRAIVDWSTVLFALCQMGGCARLLYVLLPSVLAILASVEATRSGPMMQLGTVLMLAATTLLLWPMMRARSLRALRAASGGCMTALCLFVASIAMHAASLGKRKLQLALALPTDAETNIEFMRLALLWCTALQGHSVLPTLFSELRRASARDARELEYKLRHSRFVSKRTKMRWLVRVAMLGCGGVFALLALSARLAFPAGTALNVLQDISGHGGSAQDSSTASLQIAAIVALILGMPQHGLVGARCLQSAAGTLQAGLSSAREASGCSCFCCRRTLSDRRRAGNARRSQQRFEHSIASAQHAAHGAAVGSLLVGSAALGLLLPINILACVYDVVSGVSSALLLFVMPAALLLTLRRWQRQNLPARSGAAVMHGTRYRRASSMLRTVEVWVVLLCGIALVLVSVLVPLFEHGLLSPFLERLVPALQSVKKD